MSSKARKSVRDCVRLGEMVSVDDDLKDSEQSRTVRLENALILLGL